MKALLPDVMIFERAVRCALDYNEFFDVKDFDKADELLKEGINVPISCSPASPNGSLRRAWSCEATSAESIRPCSRMAW